MELKNFKWDQDADGIVTIFWDVPNRSMNVLTGSAITDLVAVADKVSSDASIKGLIITSGKKTGFCAGAALDEMEGNTQAAGAAKSPEEALASAYQGVMNFHKAFRKLETCGKPVAAAINGLALGGGLEVTLACHYRVVLDNPRIQLGLPEAKVGLLPGGGGTQRLPRLIGAQAALPLILQGTTVDPKKAVELKMVHTVSADPVAEAKRWMKATPVSVQPWDQKDFKIPGGGPYTPGGSQIVGSIVVHVTLDYSNLSFITAQSPYVALLRGEDFTASERAPRERVEFTVYGWSRRPLYVSGRDAWVLTEDLFTRIFASREPFWGRAAIGNDDYEVYFLNDRGGIYALGYRRTTPATATAQ